MYFYKKLTTLKVNAHLKIFLFFLLSYFQVLVAQPIWNYGALLKDSIFSEDARSVLLTPSESLLELPLIPLNSTQFLRLQFDELELNAKDFMYSFTHCNANWTVSDLHSSEFMSGFADNYIYDYDFSFTTKQSYVHYELFFPNNDFIFTKTGNYIITVYDPDNNNKILFTKRFMVYDPSLLVGAKVQQATLAEGRYTDHEIDITVNFTNIDYVNPVRDVHLAIYQGHRWDNAITDLVPSFVERKKLVYDFEEESSFEAGNEYRFFDTKSVRFYTERVQKIIYDSTDVVLLYQDYPRGNEAYSFYDDIEGYYVPNILEKNNANIEADYVWVNFCLKQKPFVDAGSLYLYGGLTDWQFNDNAVLDYNTDVECYETSLYLKQGYYNYSYLFVPEGSQLPSSRQIDGNYFQTGQDYTILVYLYDYNLGYDRLLGLKRVSSRGMF